MTENTTTPGSIPADGPLTREAVQAELSAIMSDPSHQHHHGWARGMPAASDYVQSLYARVAGAAATVNLADGGITIGPPPPPVVEDPPLSLPVGRDQPLGAEAPPEGCEFAARVEAALLERHGDEASVANVREAARQEAAWLCQGKDGPALRTVLDSTLEGLRPDAKVQADVELHSWLADMALIRHEARSAPPASAEAEPRDFAAQLDDALQEEFGVATSSIRVTMDETLRHLFAGAEGEAALRAMTRALDSLPPAARLQAYTLSARHLAGLTRLRQGQH
jgi:hypothetical protein